MLKRVMPALALLAAAAGTARAQVKAGGEVQVNTYVTGRQSLPAIAVERDGDFVVAWEETYGQDGSYTGVFAQRYDRMGARRGGEFQVNTYTTGYQEDVGHIGIAVDDHGRFVVAWAGADYEGQGWNVFARRFDGNGIGVGSDFQVNTSTTGSNGGSGYNNNVDVAMGPRGDFVVIWPSYGNAASDIKGQRFDRQGQRLGGEFVVNDGPGRHVGAGVSMNAAGDFVVAWTAYAGASGANDFDVMARRFSAAGQPLGARFQVNTYTTGTQGYSGIFSVKVALADSGRFTVMWDSFGQPPHAADAGIFGQAFAADGARVGSEFVVSTGTTGSQTYFCARASAHGDVVATWQDVGGKGDTGGVFAQRFDDRGQRRGAEFHVNTVTTGIQGVPDVALDSAGNFDVVWASNGPTTSSTDILLQRFQGLLAAALNVDTTGNQILEPGDTATVAPTWRNVNGAAQTFSATLSDPTGPAGGVPTITDGSGDYGTVADGAYGLCTDCYSVTVPDPATRPATHWDGAVTQSISPDVQGQRKTWLLHVGNSFTDVPSTSGFYRFVETLLHTGVTAGCTGTTYCPGTATARDQMAVFVLVAKEGAGYAPPACTTPVFNDVPAGSPFCRFIEELARRGVVTGCGGGSYCPGDAVTREQMAVFTLRTLDPLLDPPACGTPVFGDVPAASPFCKWIEELARRGVVTGCGAGNYCPTQPVTREQMGVFISVTFGLSLYGP